MSFRFHPLVEVTSVLLRAGIANPHVAASILPIGIGTIDTVLRFSLIELEHLYALLVVVLLRLLPDEPARLGVSRVEVGSISVTLHGNTDTSVVADEEAVFKHFLEVTRLSFYNKQDGDHQFDTEVLQSAGHCSDRNLSQEF